jgi:hypothetical protein
MGNLPRPPTEERADSRGWQAGHPMGSSGQSGPFWVRLCAGHWRLRRSFRPTSKGTNAGYWTLTTGAPGRPATWAEQSEQVVVYSPRRGLAGLIGGPQPNWWDVGEHLNAWSRGGVRSAMSGGVVGPVVSLWTLTRGGGGPVSHKAETIVWVVDDIVRRSASKGPMSRQ